MSVERKDDLPMKLPSVKIGQAFRVGKSWYTLVKRNPCSATVRAIGKTRVIRYENSEGEAIEKEVAANLITRIATNSEVDEVGSEVDEVKA